MISPGDGAGEDYDWDRVKFEIAVFRDYFISNVTKTLGLKGDVLTKAVFCEKDEKGNYVRTDVSAMWFGWNLYKKENK